MTGSTWIWDTGQFSLTWCNEAECVRTNKTILDRDLDLGQVTRGALASRAFGGMMRMLAYSAVQSSGICLGVAG